MPGQVPGRGRSPSISYPAAPDGLSRPVPLLRGRIPRAGAAPRPVRAARRDREATEGASPDHPWRSPALRVLSRDEQTAEPLGELPG
jgi:hypothetical protein